jgi:arsenite methyltransferase
MSLFMEEAMNGKRFIARLALLVLLFAASGQAQQTSMPPPTEARPLQDRIATFERAERGTWQKPNEIVQALELKNGTVVADIGAGSGYFTRRFAKAVAPNGKVYAVDIAADILGYLKEQAEKQNIHNIEIIVSRADDPMLPDKSVDLAFFCDTTHHIANRVNFYRKLSRGLKEHGRMAIVDYPPDSPQHPHNPEQLVPRSQVISEAEEAGFKLVKDFTFLPRHYFLLFEKKGAGSEPGRSMRSVRPPFLPSQVPGGRGHPIGFNMQIRAATQ